uniref:Snaclec subunit B n=1 Tax=Philodryas olfersii TaxID=120305 RepID=SLB_PHIOL|nr:RecName: Full=Snaclec subunit B; AltName: Full=C-type lectin subunit B; Flags: Precursor [Philodryas olfersii]ABI74695.1 C-type lectin precursor [Philodryas olfersii]
MGRSIFVNLGLLVVAFSLRGSEADCPSGWSSYDKYCYKVFDERKNWDEAESFCMEQKTGSHLASILSSEEGSYVANLAFKRVKHPSMWIGLSNIWNQCSWQWSDGSSLGYEAWVEGPDCVMMRLQPGFIDWYSVECKSTLPFTCKFLAKREDPAPE